MAASFLKTRRWVTASIFAVFLGAMSVNEMAFAQLPDSHKCYVLKQKKFCGVPGPAAPPEAKPLTADCKEQCAEWLSMCLDTDRWPDTVPKEGSRDNYPLEKKLYRCDPAPYPMNLVFKPSPICEKRRNLCNLAAQGCMNSRFRSNGQDMSKPMDMSETGCPEDGKKKGCSYYANEKFRQNGAVFFDDSGALHEYRYGGSGCGRNDQRWYKGGQP